MENNVLFKGIKSALVSCIDDNGNVYEDDMRRLMQWHIKEGFTGFYICGGTGEGPVLQKETRKRIAEIAVDEVKGTGADIINHIGAIDLKTAAELAEHAAKVGCDAISSVPPFFFHYGEKEIFQYYDTIAKASGLPVLMYASPLSGTAITPAMIDRLMDKIPTLIGLKWTNPDYYTMHRITDLKGGNINVINGPDETLLLGLTMGAQGGIGATYNVMPKLFVQIYNLFQEGKLEEARQVQFKVNKLIDILIEHGVENGVKQILCDIGYNAGYPVYPSKRFEADELEVFRKKLEAINYREEYL
ncbi:MAG: dihydrodipicolinate synthase family protein [Eubacteriales bacterium]|nr:dihydrodipicolinate synthase family protein [Eubacteriales bacterium]